MVRTSWIVGLSGIGALAIAGCGKHTAPRAEPRVDLAAVVAPILTPSASSASPIESYVRKREALDAQDKAIAERLRKVITDLNAGLSIGDKSGALKRAGDSTTPILQDAERLAKEYQGLEAPDAVQNFDSASAEAEGDVVDAIQELRDAMISGDPTRYNEAVDALTVSAQNALAQLDAGLRKDGFDPDAWKTQRKLVKAGSTVRTGL